MDGSTGRRGALGATGERLAVEWMEANGFRVVDRNWRCRTGEVDVVAWHGDTLVFVEVKTRAGTSTGHPFEAITPAKTARLRKLVGRWSAAHPEVSAPAVRIDAVAVHVDGPRHGIEHVAGLL
ncbi:YraN family protein [Curtobacterium sp. MCBA15_012]|uniref:YraN family protein n=1 Tax=Curtobacterium sp. MCBA15_012 TaxID=1898738 RepID=UPI0008DD9E2B|nr:YraN family protein [Curtobacterium sp. MCBA15_012]WIA98894.1 YraN family protein [Curtobacterium sp. MCBA15_012]